MRLFSLPVSLSCCMAFAPMVHAGNPKLPITTIGPVASGQAGMVVSSNSDAAKVGTQVLAQGGDAVDAAIAMAFALNVSGPEALLGARGRLAKTPTFHILAATTRRSASPGRSR